MNRWWVISDDELIEALRQVAEGEDPEIVHIELYANSTTERVEGGG